MCLGLRQCMQLVQLGLLPCGRRWRAVPAYYLHLPQRRGWCMFLGPHQLMQLVQQGLFPRERDAVHALHLLKRCMCIEFNGQRPKVQRVRVGLLSRERAVPAMQLPQR
jgi:hypothetical protein